MIVTIRNEDLVDTCSGEYTEPISVDYGFVVSAGNVPLGYDLEVASFFRNLLRKSPGNCKILKDRFGFFPTISIYPAPVRVGGNGIIVETGATDFYFFPERKGVRPYYQEAEPFSSLRKSIKRSGHGLFEKLLDCTVFRREVPNSSGLYRGINNRHATLQGPIEDLAIMVEQAAKTPREKAAWVQPEYPDYDLALNMQDLSDFAKKVAQTFDQAM